MTHPQQEAATTCAVTRSVCRTTYAHKDVTAEVPIGASESEIEEAVLDAAYNLVFKEQHAEYALSFTDPEYEAEQARRDALLNLLQGLANLGFGTDGDIPIDAIDSVAALLDSTLKQLQPTGALACRLIHSESEDGFWNQSVREWLGEEGTYHFLPSLPPGMPEDARLVDLDLKHTFGHANVCPPGATLDVAQAINQAKGDGSESDFCSIAGAIAHLEQRIDSADSERDREALRTLRLLNI